MDGTLRMCIDYKRLNAKTAEDPYQITRIDELVENINWASKYIDISTLDFSKSYYQVPDKLSWLTLQSCGKYNF